jgi:hypothetical protein
MFLSGDATAILNLPDSCNVFRSKFRSFPLLHQEPLKTWSPKSCVIAEDACAKRNVLTARRSCAALSETYNITMIVLPIRIAMRKLSFSQRSIRSQCRLKWTYSISPQDS